MELRNPGRSTHGSGGGRAAEPYGRYRAFLFQLNGLYSQVLYRVFAETPIS